MFDSRDLPRRNLIAGLMGLTLVLVLVVGAVPSLATHGGTHGEQLARASFTDDVDIQMRVKLDGKRTRVINVREPSEVVTMRITVDPGAVLNWHTHPGPVIVSVASGELTYVNADDCVKRPYPAGTAFIDPGQGNVHAAYNSSDETTVLVATFLGVVGPPTVPADGPAGCVVP